LRNGFDIGTIATKGLLALAINTTANQSSYKWYQADVALINYYCVSKEYFMHFRI